MNYEYFIGGEGRIWDEMEYFIGDGERAEVWEEVEYVTRGCGGGKQRFGVDGAILGACQTPGDLIGA